MQDNQQEPIAIIGMGCRFPGANHPQEFWQLLYTGKDAVKEVPADRWDMQKLYDPDVRIPVGGPLVSGYLDATSALPER